MVCNRFFRFSFFFICLLLATDLDARHIIGGEITYTCLGPGSVPNTMNYEFRMNIYRDCSSDGAQYDDPAEIGVYRQRANGTWQWINTLNVNHRPVARIDPTEDNPCLIIPPDVCVEDAAYIWTINDLEIIDFSYQVAYRRCCRNNSIANIVNPGGSGATYSVVLTPEAQVLCNSSPTFDEFPPIVICANEDIDFNHSATDADGDQLVYEFCSPLLGGGNRGSFENPGSPLACDGITPNPQSCPPPFPEVNFVVPTYSPSAPMAGNPVVNINPISGLISGVPEVLGQFVVGVCVTEFRNGVALSRIQRDFQFNVAFCEPTIIASISADTVIDTKFYQVRSCGLNTIEFENLSGNINFIDSYQWSIFIDGDTVRRSTRDATYDFPGDGIYPGTMIVNPGTFCADTAILDIRIYPPITADFEYDYDTCVAGDVIFTDLSNTGGDSIIDWSWQFGDMESSSEQNPEHLYMTPGLKDISLRVTDNNLCSDFISSQISYQPAPSVIVLDPDRFIGCAPRDIFFNNLSTPIDSTYSITWDFGDGTTGFDISPTHLYENPGLYSITIDIVSPIGCEVSAFFQDYIRVLPGPLAGFTFSPDMPSSFNSLVEFFDQSLDAINWQWFFDDESVSFDQNPTYNFRDTGRQEIILIVGHESGCTDSAFAFIDIQPIVSYFLPNAFSPNNDGINDTYKGKGATADVLSFRMTVWNRWGELIYETNNPDEGWNGRKNNVGLDSPLGVYSVFVEYVEPRGKEVVIEGIATLIR